MAVRSDAKLDISNIKQLILEVSTYLYCEMFDAHFNHFVVLVGAYCS